MLKALDRTRGAASDDDAARKEAKADLRRDLIEADYPLTVQFDGRAMVEGTMISVGEITLRPSFYEKSGRVAYMGGGDITLKGVKNRCNITVFLPFSVGNRVASPEATKAAEAKANADLDDGEES